MFHKKRKKTVNRLIKPKTRTIRWIVFSVLAILISFGAWIGSTTFSSINKITADSGQSSLMSLFDSSKQLKGKPEGRSNILLLGNGGTNHPGGGLTDTMIVLSVDWASKKAAMISVPRDLWAKMPNGSYAKLNAAYPYGEKNPKLTGGGGKVTSDTISGILGLPIHYYISLDFEGFKKTVDLLGGVDIYVDKAVNDMSYPADNMIDFEPFKMSVGMHQMDGATALKYARSRHGINSNDFDRSRRQQQVLSAVKSKAVSLETLSNPKKVTDLITVLGNHLKTNMTVAEIKTLFDELKAIDTENMTNKVFDTAANSPLTSQSGDERGYIIIPKKGIGVYTDLQTIAKNIFKTEAEVKPDLKIEVLNGTGKAGVAAQISQLLKTYGYTVTKVGNATVTSATQTIIYNCSGAKADETIKSITGVLSAITKPKTGCGNIDIQILVGESSL
jgi:LCP family protein required for cell wall assembly